MIRYQVFTVALLFILGVAQGDGCSGVQDGDKIVVVGAGFAGLSAAYDLLKATEDKKKIKLIILEAEKKIGGRGVSRNHYFNETNFTGVCYGAYWLTGSDGPQHATGLNPENGAAHKLAKEARVTDYDLFDRITEDTPQKSTYLPLDKNERMSSTWPNFKKSCGAEGKVHWNAASRSERNTMPFDNILQERVKKQLGLSDDEFWTFFQDYNGQISGVAPEETWAGAYWEGVAATNYQILNGGFSKLYEFLKDEIVDIVKEKNKKYNESERTKIQFKMQHTVTKLKHKINKKMEPKVRLNAKTRIGETKKIKVDKVVVTVSVAVLKSLKFSPELPSKYTNSLNAVGMGANSKTILFYKKRFWDKHIPKGSRSQKIIALTDKSKTVNGFSKMWVHPTQNFVMLIKHGEAASQCEISPQICADEAKVFMKATFSDDIPDPIAITNSDWGQNANFLGAWSYLKSGKVKTSDKGPVPKSYKHDLPRIWKTSAGYSLDRLTIGQTPDGDWKNELYFAGEATSLTVPGYIHGAIESGQRVVVDICEN